MAAVGGKVLKLALVLAFVAITGVRIWLARRYERRSQAAAPEATLCVLQPILGGDPRLEDCLRRNALNSPEAKFIWLVDEDDALGQAAAQRAKQSNVEIVLGPGPEDGQNPKLVKLERGLGWADRDVVVVLDDDTCLEREALARLGAETANGGLVTGLPYFGNAGTPFEKLLAAFVNGNAWLTYFAMAEVGEQHTINGMVYACRLEVLRKLGGFGAAGMALTDDYSMAKLFERNGLPLRQSTVRAEVSLTLEGAKHYIRVMRRWMIFARMYFSEQKSGAAILLAGIPSFLPLLICLVWPLVGIPTLLAKVVLVRFCTGLPDSFAYLFVAELLNPFFFLSSLWRPAQLTWRSRKMRIVGGAIRYRS